MTGDTVDDGALVTHAIVVPRTGDAKTNRHAYRLGRVIAPYGTVARVRFFGGPDVFFRQSDLVVVRGVRPENLPIA